MSNPIRYRPADNVIWEETSGETVLFKMDDGLSFRLNNTGTLIWKELVNHRSSDEIIQKLIQTFGGEEAALKRDYWAFISEMNKEGLAVADE
jgi:hypothetical protein